MNLIVNKDWTLSFESENDETLNANDVLWHRLNVKFDPAARATNGETVMAVFQDDPDNPKLISRETLLFESEKEAWSALIPKDVIKVPKQWYVQLIVRRYDTLYPTKYAQRASSFVDFTVGNGALLADGSPVTVQNVQALYNEATTAVDNAESAAGRAEAAAETAENVAENAAKEAADAVDEIIKEKLEGELKVLYGGLGQPTFFLKDGHLFARILKGAVNPYRIENGRLIMTIVAEGT